MNVKEMIKEVVKIEDFECEDVTDYNLNEDWNAPFVDLTVAGRDFMIFEDYDDAEIIAIQRVAEDSENEPELFNQETYNEILRGITKEDFEDDRVKTVHDIIGKEIVDIDGVGHFLATYDFEQRETESGYIYYRTN